MFDISRQLNRPWANLRTLGRSKELATNTVNSDNVTMEPTPETPSSDHMRLLKPQGKMRTLQRHHAKAFFLYRQVHLLNKKYDRCLQAIFYPSIIFTACSAIIISLYACLKLHRQIPMPGLLFFPLLACDGFSVIFIVKVAAGVLNRSNRFLASARNNYMFSRQTLFKKIARSLGRIKIRFGSTNFIDQLTPFIFIDFCLTNTVNLMLIT